MRRRLLPWLIGVGALLLPVFEPPPLWTGPYLQNVTTESIVVARIATAPARLRVEVTPLDGGAPARGFESGAACRRQRVTVDGLAPATRYAYRALDVDSGAEVGAGRFRTLADRDDAALRFAVFGDSGGQPWWVWLQQSALFAWPARARWFGPASQPAALGRELAASNPDFWLHVGDVIYPKGQQRHYATGFFTPFAAALATSPSFVVLGNHDVMTDNGGPLLRNFDLPTNGLTGDSRCYSIVDGPLRIVVLDLTQPVDATHPAIEFARTELRAATEPWLLVASHFPIDSVYREEPRADLEQHLLPLLERHRVDVVLAGHDHNYQRFGVPGAGPIQVVTGGGGKSLYPIRREPPNLTVAKVAWHWSEISIERGRLTLVAREVGTGALLDEFTIDKQALLADGRLVLDEKRARDRRLRALLE